jgi:hypothetical protein
MAIVYLTKGDSMVPVDFSISDQTGSIVDLSNTSNNMFRMALPGSMIDTVNSSTTIQSATGGVLRYTFVSPDLANAGTYMAELEIYYKAGNTSGRNITVPSPPNNITVIIGSEEPE